MTASCESRVWGPYLFDTALRGCAPDALVAAWRDRALHTCDPASDRAEARFWNQLAQHVARILSRETQ